MCGICGSIHFNKEVVRLMNQAMIHRGPDSDGFLDTGGVSLGIRRLRIIDLKTGDQPLFNEGKSIAVILNGEIYNYKELTRLLSDKGHCFKTNSDTEVLVHAYEEWGDEFCSQLQGMFAFAILDQRNLDMLQIILGRDRLGIKPLYYWVEDNHFLFASEVRAILASGKVAKKVSLDGMYSYLAFGSVQEPLTLIEGILSVPPASYLRIDIQSESISINAQKYWSLPAQGSQSFQPGFVKEWLNDAVSSHLVSEVPLGAFLSGGIDSGSIVALSSSSLGKGMRTFTLGFDDWAYDERTKAQITAAYWSSEHSQRLISQDEIIAELPSALKSMDQPTMDGINTWFVSREAKRSGLTVVLSGLGGDELFAGYPSFTLVPRLKRLHAIISDLVKIPGMKLVLKPLMHSSKSDNWRKLGEFLRDEGIWKHPYFSIRELFTQQDIFALWNQENKNHIWASHPDYKLWIDTVDGLIEAANHLGPVSEVSWLELSLYMRSTLLRDTDMMSMAHSLEVRVPFLDHHLVEKIFQVDDRNKMIRGKSKPLLRNAMKNDLPLDIIQGPKQTFSFPFQIWLRNNLSVQVEKQLNSKNNRIGMYLKPDAISTVWGNFKQGKMNWARPWSLYVLDKWFQNNL